MTRLFPLALVGLLGCSSCKEKPPEKPAEPAIAPTEEWLKGELPPAVQQGTPVAGGTFTFRVPVESPISIHW